MAHRNGRRRRERLNWLLQLHLWPDQQQSIEATTHRKDAWMDMGAGQTAPLKVRLASWRFVVGSLANSPRCAAAAVQIVTRLEHRRSCDIVLQGISLSSILDACSAPG